MHWLVARGQPWWPPLHACTKAWPCGGSTAASVHPPSCVGSLELSTPPAPSSTLVARSGPSVRLSQTDGAGLAVDQAGHRYKPGLVLKKSVERGLQ